MLTAIFGLVGVVIGGLITAGSNFLIERRRDRLMAGRTRQKEIQELKQAARLVEAELRQAETSSSVSVSRKRWWPAEAGPLEKNSWAQYRGVLALHLSAEDWKCVATAFEFIHGINAAWSSIQTVQTESSLEGPVMSEELCGRIPFGISHISAARACLEKLIRD